ncbi:MAG: DUF6440 family protein, partial [Bacteroidales bacterium]|nr:DUF6440 family protein [Bacteroidales bacterium]
FIKIYSQGASNVMQIWLDTETGVNYIYNIRHGYPGGLTPLLDSNGKPIVTPNPKQHPYL